MALCLKLGKSEGIKVGDIEVRCTTWDGAPCNTRVVIMAPKEIKITRFKYEHMERKSVGKESV